MAIDQPVEDLIWRGRLQLGDEPGIYGDLPYVGLSAMFPIELFPFDSTLFEAAGEVHVIVSLEEVRTYSGYPGPLVVVAKQVANPQSPGHWASHELERTHIGPDGRARITLRGNIPRYVTLSVHADLSTPPGLCDEIVIRKLVTLSTSHYGYLGFRSRRSEGSR